MNSNTLIIDLNQPYLNEYGSNLPIINLENEVEVINFVNFIQPMLQNMATVQDLKAQDKTWTNLSKDIGWYLAEISLNGNEIELDYATKMFKNARSVEDFEKVDLILEIHYLCQDQSLDQALELYESLLEKYPSNHWVLCCYAETLRSHGRLFEAQEILEEVLYKEEEHPLALFSLGKIRLEEKESEAAKQLFSTLSRLYPKSAIPFTYLGHAFQLQDNIANAIEMFDQAVAIDPNCLVARQLRFQFFESIFGKGESTDKRLQGLKETVTDLTEVLKNSPDEQIRQSLDETIARIKIFDRVFDYINDLSFIDKHKRYLLQVTPQSLKSLKGTCIPIAHYVAGIASQLKGDPARYRKIPVAKFSRIENGMTALLEKGSNLFQQNEWEEALAIFNFAINLLPEPKKTTAEERGFWEEAMVKRAEIFDRQKQTDATVQCLAEVMLYNKENGKALAMLAKISFEMEEYEQAFGFIERALKLNHQNPSALFMRAKLFLKFDMKEAAFTDLRKCQTLDPKNESISTFIQQLGGLPPVSTCSLSLKRKRQEFVPLSQLTQDNLRTIKDKFHPFHIDCFRLVQFETEASEVEHPAHFLREEIIKADFHRLGKNYEKAIEMFSKILKDNPKLILPFVLAGRGEVYYQLNRIKEAKQDVLQALELNKKDVFALMSLAKIKFKETLLDEALDLVTQVIDLNPQLWGSWAYRAFLYEHLEDYKKAASDINIAHELEPTNWEVGKDLGIIEIKNQNFSRGLQVLESALAIVPEDIYTFYYSCYAKLCLNAPDLYPLPSIIEKRLSQEPIDIGYAILGFFQMKRQQNAKAYQSFHQALELGFLDSFLKQRVDNAMRELESRLGII